MVVVDKLPSVGAGCQTEKCPLVAHTGFIPAQSPSSTLIHDFRIEGPRARLYIHSRPRVSVPIAVKVDVRADSVADENGRHCGTLWDTVGQPVRQVDAIVVPQSPPVKLAEGCCPGG
jgi:hypothetical protein